ncbi:MAG TPA: ADP-glyceromanno-heptose 6-epimerase [Candidatus Omnitrophota bacterium]|nr:ADP-glyceromanno-heptose 6-epimerase [Candidatus Omnitrophota bacterium]HQO37476.1 ADP-glyceromanno-heptose 6-epimerase [Candidatus Omnitrophota bacterium]HQQ06501.1 ADP-glyceromanno-heptose 6-epimerase [Candidatus Omnitrophota bacterium]
MKVIVTGGAGFIGSCLISKLNAEGIDDILVVDELGSAEKWKNLAGKAFDDYIEKDEFLELLEGGRIGTAFDRVIHMGAATSTTETDASYLIRNNYRYTRRLCEWALAKKIPFFYASSAATYGDGSFGYSDSDEVSLTLRPLNMYGYSKQLFDLWLIRSKLSARVTGFKFFNVFGPNEYHKGDMMSLVCKVFDGVKRGEPMRLFKSYNPAYADGQQKRDFIYVKDAVAMVYYFITHPAKKGIFNIGSGSARSWNDLARVLFSALDMKPDIRYIEMPAGIRDKYQYFTEADLSKLRKAGCRHAITPLDEAVKDYSGYLAAHEYF